MDKEKSRMKKRFGSHVNVKFEIQVEKITKDIELECKKKEEKTL
jgi:hypothetical protein